MDYKKIHDSIIERAKNRKIEGYTEKHHIIPKCMGGSNEAENLVELTAREHFIVHKLLVEIYPSENGLQYALWRMCNGNDYYNISNREYERFRTIFSQNASKRMLNWWDNVDNSLLKDRSNKISKKRKEWWNNASDEQIKEIGRKISKANSGHNRKHSKSTKKKLSKSAKKRWKNMNKKELKDFSRKISKVTAGENNPRARKVKHIETNKIFDTGKEASKFFGLSRSVISEHCNSNVKNPKFKFVG